MKTQWIAALFTLFVSMPLFAQLVRREGWRLNYNYYISQKDETRSIKIREKGAEILLIVPEKQEGGTVFHETKLFDGCTKIGADSKGVILGEAGNYLMVGFSQSDWQKSCGDKTGINKLPVAFIRKDLKDDQRSKDHIYDSEKFKSAREARRAGYPNRTDLEIDMHEVGNDITKRNAGIYKLVNPKHKDESTILVPPEYERPKTRPPVKDKIIEDAEKKNKVPKEKTDRQDSGTEAECKDCDRGKPREYVSAGEDRRCFENGKPDRVRGGFKAMLQRARQAGARAAGLSLKTDSQLEGAGDAKKRALASQVCTEHLDLATCQDSMWKDKRIPERFERMLKLGQKDRRRLDLDLGLMPCVAARETGTLEPLRKVYDACRITDKVDAKTKAKTTEYSDMSLAHGLGQLVGATFKGMTTNLRLPYQYPEMKKNTTFQSQIPPFDKEPFYKIIAANNVKGNKDHLPLYDAMATDAALQVELMAYTLASKREAAYYKWHRGQSIDWNLRKNEKLLEQTIYLYHGDGHPHSNDYKTMIASCVKCIKGVAQDEEAFYGTGAKSQELRQKASECLSMTASTKSQPSKGIMSRLDNEKKRCEQLKKKWPNVGPLCKNR